MTELSLKNIWKDLNLAVLYFSNSGLNEYDPGVPNKEVYLRLKGFEGTSSSQEHYFDSLLYRQFKLKSPKEAKYLAYIQMKIENPDITWGYLHLREKEKL